MTSPIDQRGVDNTDGDVEKHRGLMENCAAIEAPQAISKS